jgi:hypothetical protein
MTENENRSLVSRIYQGLHDKFPTVIDCRPIRVQNYLGEEYFSIEKIEKYSLWGLPVGLLAAKKRRLDEKYFSS